METKTNDTAGTEPKQHKIVADYDPTMLDRVLLMKSRQIDTFWRNLRRKAGIIQK